MSPETWVWMTIFILVFALVAAVMFLLFMIYDVMRLRGLIMDEEEANHAKCVANLVSFVGDEFASQVLRSAALDYDSVEGQRHLKVISREYQQGGPSVPAMWMQDRADQLTGISDDPLYNLAGERIR